MKWRVGTWSEKYAARQHYRPWFAWRPVRTTDGYIVWLAWVERGEWNCDETGGWWLYRTQRNIA